MTEERGEVAPPGKVMLAALAFAGSLLPAGTRPVSYLAHDLAVPDLVPGVVLGLLAAGAVWLTPRRCWPLFAITVIGWLLRSDWPVLAITSYLAASIYRRSPRLLGYAVAAAALAFVPPGDLPSQLGGAGLFVGLPLVLGLWLDDRRQLLAGLRERASQLEREQAVRAGRARAEERARIARDMHDVVAHRVSLMVLHAGALEMNAKDDYTAAEAELIRLTGKDALAQLRQVLGVLKSSEMDGQSSIKDFDRLLEQSRAAGVEVSRRDEGTPRDLPAMTAATVYRVVQEALTNVHKHAGPVSATVVLRYLPDAVEVEIANDPPAHAPGPLPGSGMGLVGLRERVELMGGRLSAGPAQGGFVMLARLPDGEEPE